MLIPVKRLVNRAILSTPLGHRLCEPQFAILGTGRSGTRYISKLLTAAGVRTGHEKWWTCGGPRTAGLKGDASWAATFEVENWHGTKLGQLRNPILVLDSLLNGQLFDRRLSDAYLCRSKYVEFTGDAQHDALLILVAWTRQIELISEWLWRVEDMTPTLLEEIGSRIGVTLPRGAAETAFHAVDSEVNRHSRKPDHVPLTWADLTDSPLKYEAQRIAERHDYL